MTRRDDGFTLAEMIITIALAGILITGITSVFVVSRRAQTQTEDRLSDQTGIESLSLYLSRDLQSGDPPALIGGTASCGGASVLRVPWSDAVSGVRFQAAYQLDGTRLERVLCRDLGTGWELAVRQRLVSRVTEATAATITSVGGREGARLSVTTETGEVVSVRGYHRGDG